MLHNLTKKELIMNTTRSIKDSKDIQSSRIEMRPDFNVALEREKISSCATSGKKNKSNISIEDSFGSWFEWD